MLERYEYEKEETCYSNTSNTCVVYDVLVILV